MQEYPKILYRKGWDDLNDNVVVFDSEQERKAELEGFKSLTETVKKRGRKAKNE